MFYSELKIPRGTHCCLEMEPSGKEELIDSHNINILFISLLEQLPDYKTISKVWRLQTKVL